MMNFNKEAKGEELKNNGFTGGDDIHCDKIIAGKMTIYESFEICIGLKPAVK